MTDRIEGEHHYAEQSSDGGVWNIFQKNGGAVGDCWTREQAEGLIQNHDGFANHFIQQGREEALAEIAEALANLTDAVDNIPPVTGGEDGAAEDFYNALRMLGCLPASPQTKEAGQ